MTAAAPLPLRFQLGARTLFTVRRRLHRHGLSLADALAGARPALPPLGPGDQGYLVTSLPAAREPALRAAHPGLIVLVRQRYERRYADLSGSFDAYLETFSAKARSTLRRKARKLAGLSGGALDVRTYRTPDEIAQFHALARIISQKTYQERLLDAGLPEDSGEVVALAARDRVRAWLLFLDGEPVAYLCAPAEGDTLIYAWLGHDPAHAAHSPGAVLQFEAMRAIIAEGRFRRFDFTEGDGQHKRLFATDAVACVDMLLLRKSAANRALVTALKGFDRAVEVAKLATDGLGLRDRLARLRR